MEKLICVYCGKECKNNNAWKQHQVRCKENPNRIVSPVNITTFHCDICNRDIAMCGYKKHLLAHENNTRTVKLADFDLPYDNLFCKYCGKQYDTKRKLVNHERRCPTNPNRQISFFETVKFKNSHEAWNKGHTKETDERVAKLSDIISKSLKGKPGHPHTEETKEKLRQSALDHEFGGFHMRRARIMYRGIQLDSPYELEVAIDLDNNGIAWIRPGRIKFCYQNRIHYYTPDFYLPDYDIYLDPKNDYLINTVDNRLGLSGKDKISLVAQQNNLKIYILDKTQLSWEYIKTLI